MNKFFCPSSIAIFGVSPTGNNLARIIVENLDRFGFNGKVFPVGATREKLGKRKIVASVNEIKDVPDLAVVLVPGRFVPKTLMACGKKGIRHVIIESGGFSEFDESKQKLEDQIRSIAEQFDIQVIGPNCFGVINLENDSESEGAWVSRGGENRITPGAPQNRGWWSEAKCHE